MRGDCQISSNERKYYNTYPDFWQYIIYRSYRFNKSYRSYVLIAKKIKSWYSVLYGFLEETV